MHHRISFIIALILSLLLTLTSVTVGAARGMAPIAGWVMLCAAGDATFVPVDSTGRPTGPHTCPDCTAAPLALPPPAAPAKAVAPARCLRAAPVFTAIDASPAPAAAFTARGPPRSI